MKKKSLLLLLASLVLIGCSSNETSSNTSTPTTSTPEISVPGDTNQTSNLDSTSQDNKTSEDEVTSEQDSNNESNSEIEQAEVLNISQVKELAKAYVGKENEVGVYESNKLVLLKKVQLVSVLDAITTKKGYGDRYKLLVADETGYIYIKIGAQIYEQMKKYANDRSSYDIEGYISLYNGEVELTCNKKPTWLGDENNYTLDFDTISKSLSIEKIYDEIKALKTNVKGIAFGELVNLDVQCLATDFENSNVYFGVNDFILNVHGSDKLYNKFTEGSSYHLIGAIQMFNYRPGLVYVDHKLAANPVDVDFSNVATKTYQDIYKLKYETDTKYTYPEYFEYFKHPFKVNGYLNAYLKDGRANMVISEKNVSKGYDTMNNAISDKALFIKNKDALKLDENSLALSKNNKFINEYNLERNLTFTCFPYLWNTGKYHQVYVSSWTPIGE